MQTAAKTFKRRESRIWLNKLEYIGFKIGELPSKFAFIYDANEDREGVSSWFNHKGLTYIAKQDL
jgi:hypothetical protein